MKTKHDFNVWMYFHFLLSFHPCSFKSTVINIWEKKQEKKQSHQFLRKLKFSHTEKKTQKTETSSITTRMIFFYYFYNNFTICCWSYLSLQVQAHTNIKKHKNYYNSNFALDQIHIHTLEKRKRAKESPRVSCSVTNEWELFL